MKADKIYQDFLKVAKLLLKDLDIYGENQYRHRPGEKQLTIGEFYDYLLSTTTNYYIPQIRACLDPKSGNTQGKKTFKGKMVFWQKNYPSIFKYSDITKYKPVQPENPAKTKDDFFKFIKIMNKTAEDIDKSQSLSKAMHPDFGMLSALEWYNLILMNFKDQLKVKDQIDSVVRNMTMEGEI